MTWPTYPDDEVPTIGELASEQPRWVWLYCTSKKCGYYVAAPLVPFIILWGPEASSNRLRRLPCSKCGNRQTHMVMPSSKGLTEPMEFPVYAAMKIAG